jgi:ribosomal protein S27AE
MSAHNRPQRASERAATVVRRIACGRCRVTYGSPEWLALELVEVLDSNCVCQVLSDWPSGLSIEVRRCRRCGGELAREAKSDI